MTGDEQKRAPIKRLNRVMRRRGWNMPEHDNTLRGRAYRLTRSSYPWWDWGHRVMVLVGTNRGGNDSNPHPETWWYRVQGRRVTLLRSYEEYRAAVELELEDDWHWIGWGEDDDLRLGYYESGAFYGLSRVEQKLLVRWLLRWRLQDWFGLRSWLYSKALTAAVHQRKPFSCQQVPAKGSGGYDHWHCQLKRNHVGPHQYNAYQWTPGRQVEHRP